MIKDLNGLLSYTEGLQKQSSSELKLYVSLGTCGLAAGTTPVLNKIYQTIEERNLKGIVDVVEVGCMGLCHSEPCICLENTATNESVYYGDLSADQIPQILEAKFDTDIAGAKVLNKTWTTPEDDKINDQIQTRIVLRNSGVVNPEKIDDYILRDGYKALAKALTEMKPAGVISEVELSGLRGRGGGGFPTGKKWQFAASQDIDQKYLICNADEGDPGAFMDRAVLEGDPHSVLEAMTIAGYGIGADKGYIYIRAEYPLAIKRLEIAIAQAEEMGFLGKNIYGSGFNFSLELKYGAGAFVCGEETALIHSIEGKRGEPTFKPPFPAISGLWGKPTIVNNVETFANIAAIIRNGADWFKKIGTEGSSGTKVFALAGKINKVGLVEVPMGTVLRDIIYGLGHGIINGKEFKAVQTGGPSGGCIKSDKLDTAIDYESLKMLGSMMGSGGMIVMDEDDCMVDIAKFFLDFTLEESCGKCTPCRIGNTRLHELLEDICSGNGTMETIEKLRTLSAAIKDTALCGLGQTSPNPVISTLNNFYDEYIQHIERKKCPAGVCTKLVTYEINDKCVGCTLCARNCPVNCISGERKAIHRIDQSKCIKCGVCYSACKFHAIDRT